MYKIKRNIYLSIRVLLCIMLLLSLAGCFELKEIDDIDFTTVKSGEYLGEDSNSLVSVKVSVEVEQPLVKSIKILEHDCGRGKKAENIIDSVLEKQSLKVDAVAGATISSNVILKAIENALKKGIDE